MSENILHTETVKLRRQNTNVICKCWITKTKYKCHLQMLDYTEYKGCRDAYIKRNSFYNKISLFCALQDLKHGNSDRTNLFSRIKENFTGENKREVGHKT